MMEAPAIRARAFLESRRMEQPQIIFDGMERIPV